MDFGLSRILEMFEDRFGRRVTTVLIGAVGLALFVYSVRTVLQAVIELKSAVADAFNNEAMVNQILVQGAIIVITTAIGWTFMEAVVRFRFQPRLEKAVAEKAIALDEAGTKAFKRTSELHDRTKAMLDEIERIRDNLKNGDLSRPQISSSTTPSRSRAARQAR